MFVIIWKNVNNFLINKDLMNVFNSIENYVNINRRIVRNKVKIIVIKFINELF